MKFKTTLFLLLLSITAFSQDKGLIRGSVSGEGEAIEYANLLLRTISDSTIVKTSISLVGGEFEFLNVPYNSYFIEISHIGYTEYRSEQIVLNQSEYEFPAINLEVNSAVLATAVVTARRPIVTKEIDRMIVNVEGSFLEASGNTMDILDSSPGLLVNLDGSISIAGKEGVQIYIDGRQSYLSGSDLTSFLENLPSNSIARVEIITNPPASFEASGNAGVINIITKKSQMKGYNGSISMQYRRDRFNHYTPTANFNYRAPNFNFFGSLGLSSKKSYNDASILRNIQDEETNELLTKYTQNSNPVYSSKSLNSSLGFDYFISDNTTVGVVGRFYGNKGEGDIDNEILLSSPDGTTQQTTIGDYTSDHDWTNIDLGLNFQHKFGTDKHSLSFDLGHVYYDDTEVNDFINRYYSGTKEEAEQPLFTETSRSSLPETFKVYTGRIDYSLPIPSIGTMLEFGAKSSYIKMDLETEFLNFDANNNPSVDTNFTNNFQYSENINAAYTNLKYQITDQLGLQTGVRMEQISREGREIIRNRSFNIDKVRFFPTAYLSYDFGSFNTIGMSYGRRIERPEYESLSPVRIYYDEFTFAEGNKGLNPQITDNFELSYLGWGGVFSGKLYYSKVNDIILESIFQNVEENQTIIRPENLAQNKTYGASFNANLELTDFYSITFYLNYYHKNFSGTLNELPFELKQGTFSGLLVNRFSLGDGWVFSTASWYTSKSTFGTYTRDPFSRVSFFITKNFLDGDAYIRLLVNDVFQGNNNNARSNFQNIDITNDIFQQSRSVNLTFTYKFSGGKGSQRRAKSSSFEDEKGRINIEE